MTTGKFVFNATHRADLRAIDLLDLYVRLIESCDLGAINRYRLVDWDFERYEDRSVDALRILLQQDDRCGYSFETNAGFRLGFVSSGGTGEWSVWQPGLALDGAKLERVISLCEALFRLSDPPAFIGLGREERDVRFVPSPPLARHRHVMMTTEAEAGEMYDDPKLFWRVWDTVLEASDRRLCVRGRRAAELHDFIVRAFEGNVLLAHHARPGMTEYGLPDARLRQKLEKEYGPWWVLGPREEEKAGMPALTLVGHDPNTNTIHYTGLIEREGQEESGRVQVRELYELDRLRYDEDGDPVPGRVHVLFLDEWMARQERRPLLDVGARVFYYAKDGTKVEVTE